MEKNNKPIDKKMIKKLKKQRALISNLESKLNDMKSRVDKKIVQNALKQAKQIIKNC